MLPAIPPLIPGSGIYKSLQSNYAYLTSIEGELVNTINIWKGIVLAASTTNVQLFGIQTIDSVGLVYGDLVLLKNQNVPKNNGLYVMGDAAWERAPSLVNGTNASGIAVYVVKGTDNMSKIYVCTNDSGNDIVGVADLSFASVANGGTNYQLYYNNNGILSSDTSSTDGVGNISATSLTTTGPIVAGSYVKSNNLLFGLNKGIYFNDGNTEIKNNASVITISDNIYSNVPIVATRYKLNNVADNTDYSVSYSNSTVSINITGQSALSLGTSVNNLGYLMSPEFSFNSDSDTSVKYTNSSISFTMGGTMDHMNVSSTAIVSKVPYIGPNYYTTTSKNYGISSSGLNLNFKTSDVSVVVTDSTKVESFYPIITNAVNFSNAQIYTNGTDINVAIGGSSILSIGSSQIVSQVPVVALNYPFKTNTTTGLFNSAANTIDFNINGSNRLKLDTKITSQMPIRVPESTNLPSYAFASDTNSGIYKSLSIDKTLAQYPIFNTGDVISSALDGTTLALAFTGSVSVYTLTNGKWTFQQSISPPLTPITSISLNKDSLSISVLSINRVYIYKRTGSVWASQTYVTGNISSFNGYTQDSIAIGAVIMSMVYVLTQVGGTWTLVNGPVTNASLSFGQSVSLYQDTLIAGSSSNTYVYIKSSGVWTNLQQTINVPGTFVSVYQDTLAICNATTLYVYIRSVGVWTLGASFTGTDNIASLSMYGNRIAIGTSGPTGRVYVYQYVNSQWVYSYYVKNDDTTYQGNYVSVYDHTMVSGGKYIQLNTLNQSIVYTLPSSRYNVSFSVNSQNALSVFDNSVITNQLNVSNTVSASYYLSGKPFIIGTGITPLTLNSGLYNLYGLMTVSTASDLFYIEDNTTYFITGKTGSTDSNTVIFCTTVYRLNDVGTLGSPAIGSNSNLSITSTNPPVLQLTDSTDRSYIMTVFVSKF